MSTEPWKYAENTFLTVTEGSFSLMGEIIGDHLPRLTLADTANPDFDGIFAETINVANDWDTAETTLANAEAAQKSATLSFTEKIDAIGRKPDAETNSPLETWDTTIRSQVPYQGSVYTYLLPLGREPFTSGSYDSRLDALRDLGIRLATQTTRPVLLTLGLTVAAYHTAARTLRTTQTTQKAALTTASDTLEATRILTAQQLYANVGFAMYVWRLTPERIKTLFDLSLIRNPSQPLPAPPADVLWTPATRTLSTSILPTAATRLTAWRLAPGGAPEQLATGEFDALGVLIPSTITFTPGITYQLWLQGRNARGPSTPSPTTAYTAP